MMAAGLATVAHDTGGPRADIIVGWQSSKIWGAESPLVYSPINFSSNLLKAAPWNCWPSGVSGPVQVEWQGRQTGMRALDAPAYAGKMAQLLADTKCSPFPAQLRGGSLVVTGFHSSGRLALVQGVAGAARRACPQWPHVRPH
jgi:hypothetical protein